MIGDGQMLGQPTGFSRRRATVFQGGEESVADEGVLSSGAGIPVRLRNLREAGQHPNGEGVASIGHDFDVIPCRAIRKSRAVTNTTRIRRG